MIGPRNSVDSHRNILTHNKTFTKWAVKESFLSFDPLASVEPIGKRRRGKPQLRIDEARVWLIKAFELAETHEGAVAALMTLLLNLRASEITKRLVRDLDNGGSLLWITSAKTEAGKRALEIPESLRPYLVRLTEGKGPEDLLFGYHRREWPRAWVRRVCRAAGVPAVCAHAMRGLHSALATLGGHERALAQIAANMGHTSSRITVDHYIGAEVEGQAKQKHALRVLLGGVK